MKYRYIVDNETPVANDITDTHTLNKKIKNIPFTRMLTVLFPSVLGVLVVFPKKL